MTWEKLRRFAKTLLVLEIVAGILARLAWPGLTGWWWWPWALCTAATVGALAWLAPVRDDPDLRR